MTATERAQAATERAQVAYELACDAEDLYADGWRASDRETLKARYALSDWETKVLVCALGMLEDADDYEAVFGGSAGSSRKEC